MNECIIVTTHLSNSMKKKSGGDYGCNIAMKPTKTGKKMIQNHLCLSQENQKQMLGFQVKSFS